MLATPLVGDRLVLITAETHPLAAQNSVAFRDILDEPFVGLTGGAVQAHLALHAQRLGRHLGYRVRLRSFDAVCRLVEAGIGVGVVPHGAAIACRAAASFAVVRLADGWADRRLTLVRRADEEPPLHARLLADAFVAAAHDGRTQPA